MSEEAQTNQKSELDLLKERATKLGLTFSNNIKPETLKAKIEEATSGEPKQSATDASETAPVQEAPKEDQPAAREVNPLAGETEESVAQEEAEKNMTPEQARMARRKRIIDEQMKLVRIRIQCLDPKKKNWNGEIITVANRVIGAVKKFVPFGEATDDGYHVPYCIYNYLNNRRFLQIRTKRDKRTGTMITSTTYAKEFAIEVLPQLTEEELARLANAQAAAGGVED